MRYKFKSNPKSSNCVLVLNADISHLEFQISNFKSPIAYLPFPRPAPLNPNFHSGSAFARAPTILPGMPSGRPCALAKTSARTRKHCLFSPFILHPAKSDNVLFPATHLLRPSQKPCQFCFCLLNADVCPFNPREAPIPRAFPCFSFTPGVVPAHHFASDNIPLPSLPPTRTSPGLLRKNYQSY